MPSARSSPGSGAASTRAPEGLALPAWIGQYGCMVHYLTNEPPNQDGGAEQPLFLRVAAAVENDIIAGALAEGERVPSTNEIAAFARINPATAFTPTRQPASRRSAVIRGDPYVPRCEANNRAISTDSAMRWACRLEGSPCRHL